jgi:hypothetical protein
MLLGQQLLVAISSQAAQPEQLVAAQSVAVLVRHNLGRGGVWATEVEQPFQI